MTLDSFVTGVAFTSGFAAGQSEISLDRARDMLDFARKLARLALLAAELNAYCEKEGICIKKDRDISLALEEIGL
jgi:hypothetical protein